MHFERRKDVILEENGAMEKFEFDLRCIVSRERAGPVWAFVF